MLKHYDQTFQRRCERCTKAHLIPTLNDRCQLYCTMRREVVSPYDQCKHFVYGRLDKTWVK